MALDQEYLDLIRYQIKESRNAAVRSEEESIYHSARAKVLKAKLKKLGFCVVCLHNPIGPNYRALCVPCASKEDS